MNVKCVIADQYTQVICECSKPSVWERIRTWWNLFKARYYAWRNGEEYKEDNLPF